MTEITDSFGDETYGQLTVIKLTSIKRYITAAGSRQVIKHVECLCSCGESIVTRLSDVKSGRTTSCGCAKRIPHIDLTGMTFSRLLVVKYASLEGKWECLCDCGNTHLVKATHLKSGAIRSCGCLRDETTSKMSIANLKSIRESLGLDPDKPLTDESTIQRSYFNKLAKEVMERDSFCCVWCNNSESKLNVHHITPWQYRPELRFDRKNLITLCTTCHKSVHKFGYHKLPDPIMSILMEGYSKYIEDQLENRFEVGYDL